MSRGARLSCLMWLTLCLFGNPVVSRASIVGPYNVDDWTMHIWHFDEPAGSTAAVDEAVPQALSLNIVGTATLGNPSFAGFGAAIQTTNWIRMATQIRVACTAKLRTSPKAPSANNVGATMQWSTAPATNCGQSFRHVYSQDQKLRNTANRTEVVLLFG